MDGHLCRLAFGKMASEMLHDVETDSRYLNSVDKAEEQFEKKRVN